MLFDHVEIKAALFQVPRHASSAVYCESLSDILMDHFATFWPHASGNMTSFTQGPGREAEMLWKKRIGDITAEHREHADDPSFKATDSELCLTIAQHNSYGCARSRGRTNRTFGKAQVLESGGEEIEFCMSQPKRMVHWISECIYSEKDKGQGLQKDEDWLSE